MARRIRNPMFAEWLQTRIVPSI